ncbi:MAG TPA: AMP-binding protein [Ktedonobacterales bacterium]|nr:AMP-binding protein [Ktedonobacterales bacterium]
MLPPNSHVFALALDSTGSATISDMLAYQARIRAHDPFVVFEDAAGQAHEMTYATMDQQASRMANLLRRLGVGKGATIHVHLPNCVEFYICWFGAVRAGAVIVPTNPLATADELRYIIEHAECRLSVTQPDLLSTVSQAAQPLAGRHQIVVARTDSAPGDRVLIFSRELAREAPKHTAETGNASDVAGILYTSGTTSLPKGVLITNASYIHAGEAVAQHLRLRPDDRMLIALPLFHGNAQYYSTMPALVTGASIALMERFSASRWARQAADYWATVASLFAAPIRMLLAQPLRPDDSHNALRVTMFAQNITEEQLTQFEQRFGCPLIQLYGMTETVAPATLNPLYGERRNMSMGRPLLPTQVRIVDGEGSDVPEGTVGQLLVRGHMGRTIMAGYLKNTAATAETVRDGWLYTGDNVRADADGYIYFVDRGKDMIKRAGENIATSEIERVINMHPAVFESAAIGIPDALRDEAIKVFVVLHPGAHADEADITEWCRTRLAKFKIPSAVEFVESLPRTSVGKIQKHILRAQEQEHHG